MEIPLNISDRAQRNCFFTSQLPRLERDFTLFWSSHLLKFDCGDLCCKAIVIDGFQKPDRFVCQFAQDLIHSEELGNLLKRYLRPSFFYMFQVILNGVVVFVLK
jgi:hypothetical protein